MSTETASAPSTVGQFLDGDEWLAATLAISAQWNVAPGQVLVSPWGYPPLPRPIEPASDGTGRVPRSVHPTVAAHPGWWLPWDVAAPRPGEPDDLYHLRLYLELVARGWLDAETATVYDAITAGTTVDLTTQHGLQLLTSYQAGVAVAALARFELPWLEEPRPGWSEAAADGLVDSWRDAWRAHADGRARWAQARIDRACETVGEADVNVDLAGFYSAGETLLATGQDELGWINARKGLSDAVDGVCALIRGFDDAAALLVAAADQQVSGGEVAVDDLAVRVHGQDVARRARIDDGIVAVYMDPSGEQLAGLLQMLLEEWHSAVAEGRSQLAEYLRMVS